MIDNSDTSRRDFVAAAAIVTAAAGAASGALAQAQPPSNLRFSNPPGLSKPPSYSHVVEVNGPHRTVYLACTVCARIAFGDLAIGVGSGLAVPDRRCRARLARHT